MDLHGYTVATFECEITLSTSFPEAGNLLMPHHTKALSTDLPKREYLGLVHGATNLRLRSKSTTVVECLPAAFTKRVRIQRNG